MARVDLIEENRFSTFVKSRKSEAYHDLEMWKHWFLNRGIQSIISSTPSGYALYRNDLVKIDIHDESSATGHTSQ